MRRNTQERLSENPPASPRDDLLDFEEGLLDLTQKKKKWYQFKTVGKYFSGLGAWLPGSMSQFISDFWRMTTETTTQFISDSWQKLSQFFSSESPYPRMRDFIVHGSIALLVTTAIITTTILTMGLGPLIMAGGALSAAGIISAIAVVGLTVSAIWGGIGAAWQGFIRYLDENWSNVPEATYPLPIEDNVVGQEPDGPIPETYTLVPSNLPATAPVPVPEQQNLEEKLKQRVWQQRQELCGTSGPEQFDARPRHNRNDDEDNRRYTW